jgi:Flp pilus assembly CpaF family ATPase
MTEQILDQLVDDVRDETSEWIELERRSGRSPHDADQTEFAEGVISRWFEDLAQRRMRAGEPLLEQVDEERLGNLAIDYAFGAGPLERYLKDPMLTDIHINGCESVWLVDRNGLKRPGDPVARSDEELIAQIRWIGANLGRTSRRFDTSSPVLNMRLPNGGRLHAIMDVAMVPMVTIRLHDPELAQLDDLFATEMFDLAILEFLRAAIRARFNIVLCGGMGTGKTTLCRALLNEVPLDERIVTVEDELELGLAGYPDRHPDLGVLEARPANVEGVGELSLATLLRECLRMHADRIVVGEVRGPEVLGMLLAMTSGQDGSICTIHANSTKEAFERLAMYASMTPQQYSQAFTYRLVGSAVDFVIHLDHIAGCRRITSIREVVGSTETHVQSNEVWCPGPEGWAIPSGEPLQATRTLTRLTDAGFDRSVMDKPGGWWEQ